MMKKIAAFLIPMTMVILSPVQAQTASLDAEGFYIGGGLNFNSLPGVGSARGFQLIGGYEFNYKVNDDITVSLEAGYLDSGDFNRINSLSSSDSAAGLWVSLLGSVPLSRKTDMLARAGYDFGDDDGFLLGAGIQYKFDTKVALRMEFVTREIVSGLQANVVVKF